MKAGGAEPIDLNVRYPNLLSELVAARNQPGRGNRTGQTVSVVNLGISGNQVNMPLLGDSGVNRFGRDVLGLTGVTHVIIWEGINDIGLPPLFGFPTTTAAAVQAGLQQIADEARAAGLKVIGCTLTPSGGFFLPTYQPPAADAIRNEVNDWIRTSGAFDVVVDLDAVVRDPAAPAFILGSITPDGLHFTDEGYGIVAAEIFANLFRGKGRHAL